MSDPAAANEPSGAGQYVVVARRYRPQTFGELVGQEHVAKALSNAITSGRVGHAYLFTGARGVGKTSAARILAKALNCESGPSPVPCNRCETCQSISSGDDVDVLEIDGASNRGIEEMRQLRQNVNIRPSRSRFKIYIIDEVHMLTREAFNALLKTLEEPPEHVKFIFCTTEPTKIPITILSRCQRFDFAGIEVRSIAERLRQIVDAEGVQAEPEALEILARLAAGSMRDSQSLLEQLLAFGNQRITVAEVHGMLGTAGDRRLIELVSHLVNHDPAGALADLDAALAEGVDVGQLLDQLVGYFRDCMAAAVGCAGESFLYAPSGQHAEVIQIGHRVGLDTTLAIMQILDQTLTRLRYSTHARTLAELALVRICRLEDLEELAELVAQLRNGLPPGSAASPAVSPTTAARAALANPAPMPAPVQRPAENDPPAARSVPVAPVRMDAQASAAAAQPASRPAIAEPAAPEVAAGASDADAAPLADEMVAGIWREAASQLPGMLGGYAVLATRVAISAPNRLAVFFNRNYNSCKSFCERPEQVAKIEQALAQVSGRAIRVEFALSDEEAAGGEMAPPVRRPVDPRERLREKSQHPLVRRAEELFEAKPFRVEEPET